MKNNLGFTLIEVLVAIAIASVLVSIAVPSFEGVMSESRQVSHFNKVSATLRYARSEAIKRSSAVSVCPRDTDTSCGTDWSKGLLVFSDAASDGDILKYSTDDVTLRTVSLPASGITMTARAVTNSSSTVATTTTIRFNGRGQSNWLNGTVLLCDKRGASHARALVMTGSGIGRKAYATSSSNQVVLDAFGTAVSCA